MRIDADQRMYASGYGRFATADPSRKGVSPGSSGTWNAYAYVKGDPVGSNDTSGLFDDSGDPNYCDDNPGDPACQYPCDEDPSACGSPGPGQTSPTPPQPPPPTCTVGLYERPAFFKNSPWGQTFLWIDCSNWDGTVNPQGGMTIDGDPGRVPVVGQPLQQSGWLHAPYLVGFVSPVGTGPGKSNPATATEIGSLYPIQGQDLINSIESSVFTYDYQNGVQPYTLFPFGKSTYNSNSFTYTLLQDFNLLSYFFPATNGGTSPLPISAPGWGNLVPGLNP